MSDTQTAHLKHARLLNDAAKANNWRVVQDATMRILDGSCLYDLAHESRHYENFVFGNDWEYVEVGFEARSQKWLSRHKKKVVHYSVMSVRLPRQLPNVVFDSLKHQRRQFRVIFDKKQYIQLEGNFDKYFATYFANEYTIDDLSFITPEVMESLIAADDYDIEIVHNSLLLFGPLKPDPGQQLNEMSNALALIRKKLLNNILTYRDERVPYNDGRRIVARTGMFLKKRYISNPLFLTIIWSIVVFFLTVVVLSVLLSI